MAMLGTALLAKATDPRIDAFSLKVRDFPTAYNARDLCKRVLVPACIDGGVRLPTAGPEPLNNQPFFRSEQVSRKMMVHSGTRPDLDYLCECLSAVDAMEPSQATEALAAFLRVGLEGPVPISLELAERALELPDLIETTRAFVSSDPEGGKRGQALVAACLSLVFEDVHTRRVNDPGRGWPGDVSVGRGKVMTLAAEVKQRAADPQEALQFASRCQKRGCRRAVLVMLDPEQPELPMVAIHRAAWERFGVHLSLVQGAHELVATALTWTPMPLEEALSKFPRLMLERLEQLEVSQQGLQAWAAPFQAKK